MNAQLPFYAPFPPGYGSAVSSGIDRYIGPKEYETAVQDKAKQDKSPNEGKPHWWGWRWKVGLTGQERISAIAGSWEKIRSAMD